MTSTTAEPIAEAQAALAATATADLLTKAFQLTHQMHAAQSLADTRGYPDRAGARALVTDLRAARDLITAEVLRRTGDPDQWVRDEVDAGRACGDHDRPLPCIECQG